MGEEPLSVGTKDCIDQNVKPRKRASTEEILRPSEQPVSIVIDEPMTSSSSSKPHLSLGMPMRVYHGNGSQPSSPKLTQTVTPQLPQLCTTLMLENIPVNYTRDMLIGLFENLGFAGQYDFIFLPIDFSTRENQGWAFVNLINLMVAAQFTDTFQGFTRWWRAWSKEVCKVTWANLQGIDIHIEHYRNSPLMHELVPDEFKPAVFCHGVRCPFPPPTIRLPEQETVGEPMRVSHNGDNTNTEQTPPSAAPAADATILPTTIMLQNLPTNYTREMLIGLFDNQGFAGQYDFVQLSVNFVTHENRGYAHVNLVDAIVAARFWDIFQGFSKWWRAWCKEVCEVSWSPVQGLEANIERYRNSPLMHDLVPDEFKPALFSAGARSPFPLPTKKLRVPRIRHLGLSSFPADSGE